MRFFYFLFLLVLLVAVGAFAFINSEKVPINYVDRSFAVHSISFPMSALIAGVYVLGMLSGWTVIGFLKRSLQGATERPRS